MLRQVLIAIKPSYLQPSSCQRLIKGVSRVCLCFFQPSSSFPISKKVGEGNGTPLQYSCLENPMDRGAWWAAVHGVTKRWTWLSDFPFTFHFHALEKEMATHSSVLAWRIPGTEEPGGLPSMGSHRVGHDWCILATAAEYILHSWIIYVCNTAVWNTFHISVVVKLWKLFVLAK